ncbi:hypothetical protein BLL38_18645 [Pseudomonas gessardii]|nr:hypothetical protein BLL38_18645 [Pseudomonas gessardii]
MPGRRANGQAGAEQLGNSRVQIGVRWPPLALADGLGLLDALGLPITALLVILAGVAAIISTSIELKAPSTRPVHSSPFVSCITWWLVGRSSATMRRPLESIVALSFSQSSTGRREWRSIDSISRTFILARIFQQAQQLWPVGGGAAGVLQVHPK